MQISPVLKKRLAKELLVLVGCWFASITIEAAGFTPPPPSSLVPEEQVPEFLRQRQSTPPPSVPKFDPTQPFEEVSPTDAGIPQFDPTKPFEKVAPPPMLPPQPPNAVIPKEKLPPPLQPLSQVMPLSLWIKGTLIGSLLCFIAIMVIQRVGRILSTMRPKQFGLKPTIILCAMLFSAAVCGTALFIYNDYQAKQTKRINEEKAQAEEIKHAAEDAARWAAVAEDRRLKMEASRKTSEAASGNIFGNLALQLEQESEARRIELEAVQKRELLREIRRGNDIAERAVRERQYETSFQTIPQPTMPQTIIVQPDLTTQLQNQQALDEIRRMRELQEREDLRRTFGK